MGEGREIVMTDMPKYIWVVDQNVEGYFEEWFPFEIEGGTKFIRADIFDELIVALKFAVENLAEINMSNYDHEDVWNLNAQSVRVILHLQEAIKKVETTNGK